MAMTFAILERGTKRELGRVTVTVGRNYPPSAAEYVHEAQKTAVEDKIIRRDEIGQVDFVVIE